MMNNENILYVTTNMLFTDIQAAYVLRLIQVLDDRPIGTMHV